jgi:glutathione S-transferase
MISEWLARAAAEYGVEGAVGDEKLAELDARLAARSFLATRGAVSLADLAAYGTTHGALCAMAREKRHALVHLTRWCDHVGAVSGGARTFGAVPFPRAEPMDLSPPGEDK